MCVCCAIQSVSQPHESKIKHIFNESRLVETVTACFNVHCVVLLMLEFAVAVKKSGFIVE